MGMTGIIYELGKDRVVKKARQSQLSDAGNAEYMNTINQQTLENESQVFKRLGKCEGIIPYFQISQYGIELARAQDDLESYMKTHPEPEIALKVKWILSLIKTFSHIHNCRIFVDDIALRNILIIDNQLKVADFGQSILLPPDADITSATEGDLNARIEILHLGWILYSIISWQVHKYYFFDENPELRWPDSFPVLDNILCGKLIENCWLGGYISMDQLQHEALQFLSGYY
jgi:serine/threonine protein kinase